jgi:putative membrane protein
MADRMPKAGSDRFEVRVTADSHFGWIRTRLSLERTMMAWLRTAASLIGFGFAIVQFFERLRQYSDVRPAFEPHAAMYIGLGLISCGVLSLLVAIWQYVSTVRYLRTGSFALIADMEIRAPSPVLLIAILLVFVGVFAFTAVLLRLV